MTTTTATTTTTTSTARRRRMVRFVAAAAVAALVAAACGGDTTPAADPPAPATTEPSATAAAASESGGAAADRHDCETISAVRHGDVCRVGGQWWAPDGSGGWVESDEPSAPTTTVAQTGTVADIEEDGESPRESEVPSEQVCIDGVCPDEVVGVQQEEADTQQEEAAAQLAEAVEREGEWVGAETDDPVAVVDPVAVQEAGQTIAEPVPELETTPEPCQEGQHRHDDEPCHVDETESEPEPTPEPEPEQPEPTPEPEPEASLPDCDRGTVLDTPCVDQRGNEQSVASQQNRAFGGTYLTVGDFVFMDATSTISNHPRDHDVDTHRATVYDSDLPMSALRNPDVLDAVHPAARGDQPRPLSGHLHGHLPPFTPAVQAWSDWCFFDLDVHVVWPEPEDFDWPAGFEIPPPADSTYWCAEQLHAFAFYLTHLEAPEDCILPKATAKMEATEQWVQAWFTPRGSPEGQAINEIYRRNHFLHCPNVIYPDPDAVFTPEEHYAIRVRYAGEAGVTFDGFVDHVSWDGEPTQRQWRSAVIGAIPNFVVWGG